MLQQIEYKKTTTRRAEENNKTSSIIFEVELTSTQKIDFIKFQNFYVSSIRLEQIDSDEEEDSDEETNTVLLENYKLMKNPHYENKTQDWFIIPSSEFLHPINTSKRGLRFTLYQPSSIWKTFELRELEFYEKKNKTVEEATDPLPLFSSSPPPMATADKSLSAAIANLSMLLTQLEAEAENLSNMIR